MRKNSNPCNTPNTPNLAIFYPDLTKHPFLKPDASSLPLPSGPWSLVPGLWSLVGFNAQAISESLSRLSADEEKDGGELQLAVDERAEYQRLKLDADARTAQLTREVGRVNCDQWAEWWSGWSGGMRVECWAERGFGKGLNEPNGTSQSLVLDTGKS